MRKNVNKSSKKNAKSILSLALSTMLIMSSLSFAGAVSAEEILEDETYYITDQDEYALAEYAPAEYEPVEDIETDFFADDEEPEAYFEDDSTESCVEDIVEDIVELPGESEEDIEEDSDDELIDEEDDAVTEDDDHLEDIQDDPASEDIVIDEEEVIAIETEESSDGELDTEPDIDSGDDVESDPENAGIDDPEEVITVDSDDDLVDIPDNTVEGMTDEAAESDAEGESADEVALSDETDETDADLSGADEAASGEVGGTRGIVASGTCGDNLTWTLSETGVLTISGSGAMDDFADVNSSPWNGYNSNISTVVIEEGASSIGKCAFSSCKMSTVSIPQGVKSIGYRAFYYCDSLDSVALPSGVESIGNQSFSSCRKMTGFSIPNTVTSIGDSAFSNCSWLREITFPGNVRNFGNSIFMYCSRLESVTFSEGIEKIGNTMFSYCSGLKNVSIPSTVRDIGSNPFKCCTSLTNLSVSSENPWFSAANGVLFNKDKTTLVACPDSKESYTVPSTVTVIGSSAFEGCGTLKSITIPGSVNTIGFKAFQECGSLKNVTLPFGVTSIGMDSFVKCTSLETILLPNSLTYIGMGSFAGCSALKSITIPFGVTVINGETFSRCTSLTSITIPAGVTTVNNYAFPTGSTLKEIIFLGDAPEIKGSAFSDLTTTVYYPEGNPSWTSSVMQSYGGHITWVARPADMPPWSGKGTADKPYIIADEARWDALAAYIEEGKSTQGLYFKLDGDITVATMVGTQDNPFCASFDGDGHTLSFSSETHPEGTAPFRYIYGAAISSLHVTGSITGSNQRASGLIGENDGVSTITNCRVSAAISGRRLIGGFCIGTGDTLTITGCVFDGKITGSPDQSGCFAAWGTGGLSITDSIAAPQSGSAFTGGTFCYAGGGAPTLSNCLYMQTPETAQGMQAHSVTADPGVEISFGTGTYHDVSKIAAYETGLGYKDVFYAGKGETVSLVLPQLTGSDDTCTVNAGTLGGSGTERQLVMPDEDVVVSCVCILEDAEVVLSRTTFTWNGAVQKPSIKTIRGTKLTAGTDYTAIWSDASSKNAGTYTVTVTGKGIYTGTTSASYKINPKKTTPAVALSETSYIYDGETKTPDVTVKDGSTILKKDTDYTVSYSSGRTDVGLYKVTVKLKSNYSGSRTGEFRICFKDVPMTHSFRKAVYWAVDEKITTGYSGSRAGLFGVNDDITRGQVVTFLWKAAGSPAPKKNTQTFKDVPTTHQFYKSIQWAVEQGITSGYSSGNFGPNDNCTRGQIATFLWKYAGKKAPKKNTQTFSDVPTTHSFYKAIQWAVEQGITSGYSDGTFGVNRTCTRGQCVTFLYKMAG